MEARTAVLIALAVALGLPYVTVLLLRSGQVGMVVFGGLWVAVAFLVVGNDRLQDESDSPTDESDSPTDESAQLQDQNDRRED